MKRRPCILCKKIRWAQSDINQYQTQVCKPCRVKRDRS